jgi:hypothetical protein
MRIKIGISADRGVELRKVMIIGPIVIPEKFTAEHTENFPLVLT